MVQDQIDALQGLAERFPLDLTRVAIRGWSFGGYLAGLAVLRRPDVFHAAVAGAPVTDWRLYDTHYTERYLGHPEEEPAAYHDSLLVAGDSVIGPRAGDYGERCRRLADALGTRHFELRFAPRATGAVVTDVRLCPRLDDPLHVEATASFMVAVAEQPTRRPE